MNRTVIFDIGGVYFSDGTRIAIDAIAAKYDISRDVVADFINGKPGREYRTGKISGAQFWQRAIRKWNIRSSAGVLSQMWCYQEVEYPVFGRSAFADVVFELSAR
jgi:hypothetical protein